MQEGLKKRDLRKRAEKISAKRQEPGKMDSSKDLKEVIHDLRVHQVELEAQTEELRRAQQAIQELRLLIVGDSSIFREAFKKARLERLPFAIIFHSCPPSHPTGGNQRLIIALGHSPALAP